MFPQCVFASPQESHSLKNIAKERSQKVGLQSTSISHQCGNMLSLRYKSNKLALKWSVEIWANHIHVYLSTFTVFSRRERIQPGILGYSDQGWEWIGIERSSWHSLHTTRTCCGSPCPAYCLLSAEYPLLVPSCASLLFRIILLS